MSGTQPGTVAQSRWEQERKLFITTATEPARIPSGAAATGSRSSSCPAAVRRRRSRAPRRRSSSCSTRRPARPSVTTISTSRSTCPGHSSRRPRPTSISVPAMLRERMTVIELSGVYRRGEARHRGRALALALRRLTADDVRLTDEAVDAIIRGYAPKAGCRDWPARSARCAARSCATGRRGTRRRSRLRRRPSPACSAHPSLPAPGSPAAPGGRALRSGCAAARRAAAPWCASKRAECPAPAR